MPGPRHHLAVGTRAAPGWRTETRSQDAATCVAHIQDPDDGQYIFSLNLNTRPRCSIIWVFDDWAKNSRFGTVAVSNGLPGRAGQQILQAMNSVCIGAGTLLKQHCAACCGLPGWPARAGIQTCLNYKNHRLRANSEAVYTDVFEDGEYSASPILGRTNESSGPYSRTLATTIGPQSVPVDHP